MARGRKAKRRVDNFVELGGGGIVTYVIILTCALLLILSSRIAWKIRLHSSFHFFQFRLQPQPLSVVPTVQQSFQVKMLSYSIYPMKVLVVTGLFTTYPTLKPPRPQHGAAITMKIRMLHMMVSSISILLWLH